MEVSSVHIFDKGGRCLVITPVFVANNFLKRGQTEDINISPLKLQKLVYFLYKDYLKRTGESLFSERFETWKKGPVVPSIYAEFSSYGRLPIKTFATDSRGKCFIVTENGVFKECIDRIWRVYGNYSAGELSELTHTEGSAWSKAKAKQQRYLDIEDIKNEPEYA